MEVIANIIGLSVFVILILVVTLNLNDRNENNKYYKYLGWTFFFFFLLMIPEFVYNNSYDCDYLQTGKYEYYSYGNNFTGYHWDYGGDEVPPQLDNDTFLFHINTTYTYERQCESIIQSQMFKRMFIASLWITRGLIAIIGAFLVKDFIFWIVNSVKKGVDRKR